MKPKIAIFSMVSLFIFAGCNQLTQSNNDADTTESSPATTSEVVETNNEVVMAEAPQGATVYEVSKTESTVEWTGRMGPNSHTGLVDISQGQLWLADGGLIGGSIQINMTSIDNDETFEVNGMTVVEHLKTDDFFNVEEFPTATLVITSVEPVDADSGESGTYTVTADLTIKGITNPITFEADTQVNQDTITAVAELEIDRSLWDVRYGSSSFFDDLGDSVISDQIEFLIDLTAVEQN